MKSTLTGAVLGLLALVPPLSGAGASPPASFTGLSPSEILSTSLTAARAKGSATTIGATTVLGVHLRETTTSGRRSGYGYESVNGHGGTVVFLHGVVYAKLDAYLVKLDFGTPDPAVANKWISLTRASKYYTALAEGIAFPSVLQQMHPTGTLTTTPLTTTEGVATIGVTGGVNPALDTASGSETLYVATTAPFLPVKVVVKVSQAGVHVTITLTPKNWGVHVTVVAPRNFTSITKTALG